MPRHFLRAFASSVSLLIGLAGLLAASGCAGSPAMNTINGLLKPGQTAQSGTAPPDIFSSIAQRLGIAPATHHPAANAGATQTDTISTDTTVGTTTTGTTTTGTTTAAR